MIKTNDIIEIDSEKSWFNSGLEYALISWTSTFNRMGKLESIYSFTKDYFGYSC